MSKRKLLLEEDVEVRQFEEGLRGSWHPGKVVGVSYSKFSRSIEYNELLCETGDSKLIESIPVTEAIEGIRNHQRVPSTYRGLIRLSRKSADDHDHDLERLGFGVCVDVLFQDAWWEGVVFDHKNGANERLVFFPDEGDERITSITDMRITKDWDEFLGSWRDRGVWVLVQLANELIQDFPLQNFVKKIWYHLLLNNNMISEWTCGARSVWKKCLGDVVNVMAVDSSEQDLGNHKTMGVVIQKSGKGNKDSNCHKLVLGLAAAITNGGRNCNALNFSRLSKKGEEKGCLVEGKQNKRSLKSSNRSAANTINKNIFQAGSKHAKKKQMTGYDTGDMVYAGNAEGKSDLISKCSALNKVVNSISLPRNNDKSGKVKLDLKKPKFLKISEGDCRQLLADCLEQEKSIGYCRDLIIKSSICSRKLQNQKASVVSVRKHRKCLLKGIKSSMQFRPVNPKLKPQSSIKERGLDAKTTKDGSSINHQHPTLSSESFWKSFDLKAMVSRTRKRKRKSRSSGFQLSDNVCSFCHDGGDLILCDNCPSSYHLRCLDLKDVPDGKWYCPSCCCGFCGFRGDGEEFTDACLQCARGYHVYCPSKAGNVLPTDYPLENFCSQACYKLCSRLHQLLGISNPTTVDGLTWTLMRSSKNVYNFPDIARIDTGIKLSHVLGVMHECFEPVNEPCTNRDLFRDIVYNSVSKLKRLNFEGFYVVVLHKGNEIASVAAVRIHGLKVAEMPLVATPFQHRQQGMCRLLVQELLKLLTELGVERLILPAMPQLNKIWENSFGFSELKLHERLSLSSYPFLGFPGTMMLQKLLSSYVVLKETSVGSLRSSKESKGDSSKLSLGHNYGPDSESRLCGLFYQRRAKTNDSGKRNTVNGCNGSKQTYGHKNKGRCIFGRED